MFASFCCATYLSMVLRIMLFSKEESFFLIPNFSPLICSPGLKIKLTEVNSHSILPTQQPNI